MYRADHHRTSRRGVLLSASVAAVGLPVVARPSAAEPKRRYRYCLNTGTLRGFRLPLSRELDIVAKAGYQGIEPWIDEIQRHVEGGESASALRRRIRDHGLTVEGAIGFAEWIVDDDDRRARGLEAMKRDMELVASVGGTRIAAPPVGAPDTGMELGRVAERYRRLLELGESSGVVPMLEVWGSSKTVGTLGEALHVAVAAGHAKACMVLDIYHLFRGGSGFAGLGLLGPAACPVLHMNDYPAAPPREQLRDRDRVYPGDGVAPFPAIMAALRRGGFAGVLSLELFNETYWKQEPLDVARTGLAKMKAAAAL